MNTCSVSDPECTAPAGWGVSGMGYAVNTETTVGKTKCYICDQPVCRECSHLVTWYKRRVRACNNCIDQYGIVVRRAA